MFYTDFEEFIEYLPGRLMGALSNDQSGSVTPNETVITFAINAAEDEVNSYFAKHYNIPVQASDGTIPFRVKTLVYTVAKYQLYTRANILSPEVSEEYSNAISYLTRIARGELTMPAVGADGKDANKEDLSPVSGSNYRGLFKDFDRV